MDNISNVTAEFSLVGPIEERLGMASLLIVLAGVGLVSYLYVISLILIYKKSFANAFYKLVVALGLSDCGMLSLTLVYGVVCIIQGDDSWSPFPLQMTMAWLQTFCFFSLSYNMLVICVNRYVAVVHFTMYKEIFTNKNVAIMITVVELSSAILATGSCACNCYVGWFLYSWGFVCDSRLTCELQMSQINQVISFIPVIGLPGIYAIIFYKVKQSSKQVATGDTAEAKRKERNLMLQFSVICFVHLIRESAFWYIFDAVELRTATAIVTMLQIADSAVNPIMYLGFSSDIRAKAFKKKGNKIAGSTVTNMAKTKF